MPTYKFEAMDTAGAEVKDSVDAASEEEAQQKIRQMGYFVTKITEVAGKGKGGGKKKGGKKKKGKVFTIGGVNQKQLVTFTRQFSTLQDAGLPVLRSLKILEGQMKPGVLKNALIDVVDDVESGSTLSEAFAKHPKCFDRLYVNMVKAGEAGGALEIILKRLADFKEKAQSLKRRITGAMVYPAVVITVAVLILTGIMIFIIPKFEKIFADFKLKLPWMTTTLMETSRWFVKYWYVIPLVPVAIWLLLKLIRLSKAGTYALDMIKLCLPVSGGIVEKSVVARTMRTLGTLIASGVPILEALAIVRETCMNAVFENCYQGVYDSIREGNTIAEPMKASRLVDDMVVNMIDVGEETGDLDRMLNKVADVYDEEVNVLVESLLSLLEPIMIVVLGLIVGTIVIALFMPLLALLEGLGGGKEEIEQNSGMARHRCAKHPSGRSGNGACPLFSEPQATRGVHDHETFAMRLSRGGRHTECACYDGGGRHRVRACCSEIAARRAALRWSSCWWLSPLSPFWQGCCCLPSLATLARWGRPRPPTRSRSSIPLFRTSKRSSTSAGFPAASSFARNTRSMI